jgi:hypothetical protein
MPAIHAPAGKPARPDFFIDSTLVSLFLPLENVTITIVDETRSLQLPEQNEAFFIEVANALSQYEESQCFKVKHSAIPDSGTTVTSPVRESFRSQIIADSGSPERIAGLMQSIAEQCSVDLVILPLKASIKETISKQGGWRSDKYGNSYERPLNCRAEASISLQIWNRKGKMVYTHTGNGISRQPLFYAVFKHEKPKKEDLVQFSKNIFAPPLIRALSSAVKESFPAQESVSNRGRRY